MARARRQQLHEAAFDVVGRYNQDQINGFDYELLNRLLDLIDPFAGARIIELMAGDGNFTSKLSRYCAQNDIVPGELTMLEYSRVQSEFARMELADSGANVIWGDVLSMRALDTGKEVEERSYDRAIIKSSNHEIPRDRQLSLYSNVFRILKPGGTFINLGMLFEDPTDRDELAAIGRAKDSLAGMNDAVKNRYWLTRQDLYEFLAQAGFVDIKTGASFEYAIASRAVSQSYFDGAKRDHFDLEFQAAQARARSLRKKGMITFDRDTSLMRCPGEITIARRPTVAEINARIFNQYPYDFVRKIAAHRQLLDEAERHISSNAKILDLGCGIGLLAERVADRCSRYEGVDLSSEFVRICKERIQHPNASFAQADINTLRVMPNIYDHITLINVLYIEGIDPIQVLERCYDALAKGGRILISGPTHAESFIRAEAQILEQLRIDGLLAGNEAVLAGIAQANASLLTDKAHYWSAEGMIALLNQVGFSTIHSSGEHYYGNAYLVVAEKR